MIAMTEQPSLTGTGRRDTERLSSLKAACTIHRLFAAFAQTTLNI